MVAAAHQRQHAPALHQGLRAARRTSVADVLAGHFVRFALLRLRGHHQLDGILLHVRRDQNFTAYRAHFHNGVAVEHRTDLRLFPLNGALHDTVQFLARGVGHQDFHEEAVELRFGQRVGALHFDGILGGHHQEWTFQLVSGGAAGDGALLHGLQQRGLGLGSGAVDFIGQHQVGEDGTGLKPQELGAVVAGFDDHAAHDIGGHQVGRELDAGIFQLQRARQGAQQGGLAQARHAFQQHVPGGQQADEHTFHDVVLADNDFGDFGSNARQTFDGHLQRRFGSHFIIVEHGCAGDDGSLERRAADSAYKKACAIAAF
jgi:hypothetical protein